MLLQIFDEGRLADAKGRSVDFRNTIIIMTSNLAQKMLKSEAALGFRATTATGEDPDAMAAYERMKERVQEEMKRFFRPEFLNRIDATVVFQPLNRTEIRQIVELELVGVRKQLARQIQNEIADPLAEMLLQGKFHQGDGVRVHTVEGKLTIEKTEAEEKKPYPSHPDDARGLSMSTFFQTSPSALQ